MNIVYKEEKVKVSNSRSNMYQLRINDVEREMIRTITGEGIDLAKTLRLYITELYGQITNDNDVETLRTDNDVIVETNDNDVIQKVEEISLPIEDSVQMLNENDEKIKLNKKLYIDLIKKFIKMQKDGYGIIVEKDPESNGIIKFNLKRVKDEVTKKLWIFKTICDYPNDVHPIFLLESDFKIDEIELTNWVYDRD